MQRKPSSWHSMVASRFFITVMSVILLLPSCQRASHDVKDTRFIMGTMVSFTVVADDESAAQKAITQAANRMQNIEHAMTIYGHENNAVKMFNRTAVAQPMTLPQALDVLLQRAESVAEQSNDAFSPSLATLSLLWGFSLPEPKIHPPSATDIETIMASHPAHCLQRVSNQEWQRNTKACRIDLGGIAKGYALDEGMAVLKAEGISDAMINAGGDIRMMGQHGNRPWRIGIRDPRNKDKIIGTLALSGEKSVVTSGDYERFFMFEGRRYHHILDPTTGYPAMRVRSSTVVASTATQADAWSTALFVRGATLLPKLQAMNMMALVVDAKGRLHANHKMLKDLQLEPAYSIFRPHFSTTSGE